MDAEYLSNRRQAEDGINPYLWLSRLQDHTSRTEFPNRLYERMEDNTQTLQEGIIEIAIDRTVRIVLGTGGPHTEIVWPERGSPSIVCYGWYGKDRYERNLTEAEIDAVRMVHGEWDELAEACNDD